MGSAVRGSDSGAANDGGAWKEGQSKSIAEPVGLAKEVTDIAVDEGGHPGDD